MEKQSARNGKVEFLRLIFSLCVLGFHTANQLGVGGKAFWGGMNFSHGRLGVEFFFLLSGFFLAAAAQKLTDSGRELNLGRETFRFTLRKLNAILPYHLPMFLLALVLRFLFKSFDTVQDAVNWLIRSIPGFFLFNRTGANELTIMGDEWYISKMLLAGFILFPLLLRFKKKFARILCPLLSILLTDYLMYTTGLLGGTTEMVLNGAMSKTVLRALAEMALGIFLYEVVGYLGKCRLDKRWIRVTATVLEAGLYLLCLRCVFLGPHLFEVYFLYFAAAGLAITLSGVSYGKSLFNRRLFYFAGEMALPMYLCQTPVHVFFDNTKLLAPLSIRWQFVIICASVALLALITRAAAKGIGRLVHKAEAAVLPEEDAQAVLRLKKPAVDGKTASPVQ